MTHRTHHLPARISFAIPEADAREFASLPAATRDLVRWRLQIMQVISRAPAAVQACKEIAESAGCHQNTIYNAWRRWNEARGDWRALVDKRKTPEFWKRNPALRAELPAAFLEHWKTLVGENDRAVKPAHTRLVQDYRAWRAGDISKAIPGYTRCPEPTRSGLPRGWTYSNLLNHIPSDVELTAARKGRSAAKALMPGVTTTRVGSYPFAEIQFDDMWHNFLVNVQGYQSAYRLLEFGCVDQFSNYIFKPGLKPRLPSADDGKMKILNNRDFHLYTVNWLLDYGIHPHGTIWNVENGTAAISRDYEARLQHWFPGLITIVRSGMSGAPAHAGGYAERAKGNYKTKALKEGMGNLIQNALGHLPGQVGMHRDDCPAGLTGRENENRMLLAIAAVVPGLREKLELGFLDLHEAVHAVQETYDMLNCRTDHQIEGWAEAGLVIDEFRFSRHADDWRPLDEVIKLTSSHERQMIQMAVRLDAELRRRRNLSPAEVIIAHTNHLIKPPLEAIPDLLGAENATIRRSDKGLISFTRPEYGPLRYKAIYQDASGFRRRIENGSEVQVHFNPWKPEFIYLSETGTGRFLGIAHRDLTPTRGDIDAIYRAHGEAERDFKDAIRETAARHGLKRIPHLRANATALRKANQPTARDRALSGSSFDPSSMLESQEFDAPTADPVTAFDPADLL